MSVISVCTILTIIAGLNAQSNDFYYGTFPKDFMFGAATASYQIEGAWNIDGKGESIWDEFAHRNPSPIKNGDTGDVACDSYHLYKEDIKLLKNMGVQHYRFSISWPRLMPDGTTRVINQAGVDYYNNIINELLANGITPMVTLFHWELPQSLQSRFGGFLNESLLIQDFGCYARTCFSLFGDRVKYWITFNEPYIQSLYGYGEGLFAPGHRDPGIGDYIAGQTQIKSHARAWHIYDEEFRPQQKGQVGIALNIGWHEPKSNSSEDGEAAERAMQFELGWFAHPIYSQNGDYPPVMRENVDRKSKEQGYNVSRLPLLSKDWVEYIKGSWDFLGINHYSSSLSAPGSTASAPSWNDDRDTFKLSDPTWKQSALKGHWVVPWGLRKLMNWIKKEYGDVPVYITENGFSDNSGELKDVARSNYYKNYINELLKAVNIDGCNVKGYTAWSLLDNFEWMDGYSIRFGLHYVDFDDAARSRTPKLSAATFKDIIKDRGFPAPTNNV